MYRGKSLCVVNFTVVQSSVSDPDCECLSCCYSGEYLDYAQKNRAMWVRDGEEAVAQMIVDVREKYGTKENLIVPRQTPSASDTRSTPKVQFSQDLNKSKEVVMAEQAPPRRISHSGNGEGDNEVFADEQEEQLVRGRMSNGEVRL